MANSTDDDVTATRRGKVLYMSFGADASCLTVGTSNGYEIYNIDRQGRFRLEYVEDMESDVIIIERLNQSALVTLVADAHPSYMRVYHYRKQRTICQYSYPNRIRRILMNSRRVIVKADNRLYVHGMKNLNVIHTMRDVPPPSPQSSSSASAADVVALSAYEKNSYIALPWASDRGLVKVFDTINLDDVALISAHSSPIAQLKFDAHGTRLATASIKGTVVRVFRVDSGEVLHELRRGMHNALMYSLSFSPDGHFLAAASSANTVHVFKVPLPPSAAIAGSDEAADDDDKTSGGVFATLGDVMKCTAGLLSSEMRSVAKIELDKSLAQHYRTVLAYLDGRMSVLVVDESGRVAVYSIDTDSWEATLNAEHRLDELCSTQRAELSDAAATSAGSNNKHKVHSAPLLTVQADQQIGDDVSTSSANESGEAAAR